MASKQQLSKYVEIKMEIGLSKFHLSFYSNNTNVENN